MTPRRPSSGATRSGPRASARGLGRGHVRWPAGYSLVELLVVVGVVVTLLVAAVPVLDRAQDAADAAAAARYLASRIAHARVDALRRQRAVAIRFARTTPLSYTVVIDGDGDGVSAADIAAGVDPVSGPSDRVEDHFPRARFGIGGSIVAVDDTARLSDGDNPVRFGAADQLSLTPLGTATGGTAYITSRGGAQFAVRLSGITGRVRVLRYDRGHGVWRPY